MIQRNEISVSETQPADGELIRQAQQGDLNAFTSLYERYLPMVYNRVRYVIPEQDVEDVTQEIFIAMMNSLKSFKGTAKFSTWLRTLTNRRVADFYRKRRPADGTGEVELSGTGPLSPGMIVSMELEDSVALQEALGKLPKHYRNIILLRFAEGLRFHEIAEVQGQSLEAAKSLFRRAIATLRKEMGEQA